MSRVYAPTCTGADGCRHIIAHRDGPALCGADVAQAHQVAPTDWRRAQLCPRCLQKYLTKLTGRTASWGATDEGGRP